MLTDAQERSSRPLGIHPDSSTGTLRRMLTQGRVQVDGTTVHAEKAELTSGQHVEVVARVTAADEPPSRSKKTKGPKLNVLFEDETILVVNKPAGLLSVATNKMEDDTLHSRCVAHVRAHHGERAWVHVVHRLDRETSGVMVFARHARHKDDLQRQFADRNVHRIYRAWTEGCPEAEHGTVVAHSGGRQPSERA